MNIRTSYQTRNIVNYNRNQRYLRSKANPNNGIYKYRPNSEIRNTTLKMNKMFETKEVKNSFLDKIINIFKDN